MTRIARRHPRYGSLITRRGLARAARAGLVVPEGLIAHGRAEAFDYFLGEATTPSARVAEKAAAVWLRNARHPVLSVNGNVAALGARGVAALTRALPRLSVEVNLFHRTGARVGLVARALTKAGVSKVLGRNPTILVPQLASDRARVDPRGIAIGDVCLVPLEDGDRTEALRRLGKKVISIDLNPLSRTSIAADLPIVDELTRALGHLSADLRRLRGRRTPGSFPRFDRVKALQAAREEMVLRLRHAGSPRRPSRGQGASSRRARGTSHRSHRTR